MILRNHGTLAVGKNVGECFVRLYFLERACQAQIMALSAGDQVNNPPQGSPEVTAQQGKIGIELAANLLAWPALKRKAYRLDPSFATYLAKHGRQHQRLSRACEGAAAAFPVRISRRRFV